MVTITHLLHRGHASPPTMQGWLLKDPVSKAKGAFVHRRHLRWVVLRPDCIEWYERQDSPKLRGSLSLARTNHPRMERYEREITVYTILGTLVLHTATEEDAARWEAVIFQQLKRLCEDRTAVPAWGAHCLPSPGPRWIRDARSSKKTSLPVRSPVSVIPELSEAGLQRKRTSLCAERSDFLQEYPIDVF